MPSTTLADWSTLAATLVSAAAALIGLIFVGVSINVQQIVAGVGLTERAMESVMQFLQAFLIAACMLIPHLSLPVLGALCLLFAGSSGVVQVFALWRSRERYRTIRRSATITRVVIILGSTVPFCGAGVALCRGWAAALYWLLPPMLFSFLGGLVGAWVMLVEILR